MRRDRRRRGREPCDRARRDLRDDGPVRLRQVDAPARRQRPQSRDARAGAGRRHERADRRRRAAARRTSGACAACGSRWCSSSSACCPGARSRRTSGSGSSCAASRPPSGSASSQGQLELVGLADWGHCAVSELSGGMQQRVGLARAFATNADILLMDEPFSALDPLIRDKLQDELLALQARVKKTILFVSHDLDEALRLGDRISIMRNGRIVQTGTAQDIVLRPADDYVAEFVRRMNPLKVLTGAMVMRAPRGARAGGRRAVPGRRAALSRCGSTPAARRWSCASTARRIRCAPWRTRRPAPRTSGRSSSRRRRSRCRGSFTCAGARGIPVLLADGGRVLGRRGRDRDHRGAVARAAAQGRLHEAASAICRLHAHAGRGLRSRRGCGRGAAARAAFDLQGHRGARGLAPENTLAGFRARARSRRHDARARLRRDEGRRRGREPRPRC